MTIRRLRLTSIVATLAFAFGDACLAGEPVDVDPPADKMRGEEAGQERDDNAPSIKFVWCPAGFFQMGTAPTGAPGGADGGNPDEVNPDGAPAREEIRPAKVFLTRGYWLGKFEVTQAQWRQVMKTEPWKNQPQVEEGDEFPATHIGWKEAMEFCARLTKREREAGRLPKDWEYTLPTEAQWERACRARSETIFCCGDNEQSLHDYAWFAASVGEESFAHRVGQKKPNAWGLHDMHGNVWEWCKDLHADPLPGGRDPEVKTSNEPAVRMNRGGSWGNAASSCRSALRSRNLTTTRNEFLGFRAALSVVVKR
jgi:formylglycine-generating enzyme required for sulfatase activity